MPTPGGPAVGIGNSDRGQATRENRNRPTGLTGKCILAYCLEVVDDVFKAIADPTRRAILDELTERNGQTLFELCGRLTTKHGLGSTRQAISQHVDVLTAAGLVTTRREGRYKFHFLDTTPLREIAERWPIPDGE